MEMNEMERNINLEDERAGVAVVMRGYKSGEEREKHGARRARGQMGDTHKEKDGEV
ncbi:hypothetical protein PAMP_005307 [Pampus punctatissimus]